MVIDDELQPEVLEGLSWQLSSIFELGDVSCDETTDARDSSV